MKTLFPRLAILLGTTAFLAALPVTARFDTATGAFSLKPALALASSDDSHDDDHDGSDDDHGSDDDNDGSDDDNGSDDDHDGSDDDNGSDDDSDGSDDDNGSDDDLDGSDDDNGSDDDLDGSDDDNGSDDDLDGSDDNHGTKPVKSAAGKPKAGADAAATAPQRRVTKVEKVGRDIEVTYRSGAREQIENGRYQRKNAAGDTVEERRATAADRERLNAIYAAWR